MLRKVLITILVIVCCVALHKCIAKEEARELALIQEITGYKDARVVWSKTTEEGESWNMTYWNNDHCVGTIAIRGDKSYYVNGSHCSENKLTK